MQHTAATFPPLMLPCQCNMRTKTQIPSCSLLYSVTCGCRPTCLSVCVCLWSFLASCTVVWCNVHPSPTDVSPHLFPWTMRPLDDMFLGRCVRKQSIPYSRGWGVGGVAGGTLILVRSDRSGRSQVSANSYCVYPPPVCGPWSGHIVQGRYVPPTLPKGRIVHGKNVRGHFGLGHIFMRSSVCMPY